MKYFKLYENWNGNLLVEATSKSFIQNAIAAKGQNIGLASHSNPGRIKNVNKITNDEFANFLKKDMNYTNIRVLPKGKNPGESGSSKFFGFEFTDPSDNAIHQIVLAGGLSAQEKFEDPLVQEINDYIESGGSTKLSGQSKTIIDKISASNKSLDGFLADSKDTKLNNFVEKWKAKSKKLGAAATKNPRFSQDAYNPADIVVWNLTDQEEKAILSKSNIGDFDRLLRKYVQAGKVWPISLKAGTSNWQEFNIFKPSQLTGEKIKVVRLNNSGVIINPKMPYGLRISNQGTKSMSWEGIIKGSGGQGGKVPVNFWRGGLSSPLMNGVSVNKYPPIDVKKQIELLCKKNRIKFENNIKPKGDVNNEALLAAYELLLAYSQDKNIWDKILNLSMKKISPALIDNKKPLEQGSPHYKVG